MGLQLRAAGLAMVAVVAAGFFDAGPFDAALAQSPGGPPIGVEGGPATAVERNPAIRVEGNRRIEASSIRSYFHATAGGHFEAADLDAALKALYATNLFSDVRIARSGEALVITVKENPVIRRLALEGNRKLKDDQFKNELQSKSGGPLWRPVSYTHLTLPTILLV